MRRFPGRAGWLGGLTILGALAVAGNACSPAWASGAPSTSSVTGWVIDDQPTVPDFTPPGRLQYNSTGQANTIQSQGTDFNQWDAGNKLNTASCCHLDAARHESWIVAECDERSNIDERPYGSRIQCQVQNGRTARTSHLHIQNNGP